MIFRPIKKALFFAVVIIAAVYALIVYSLRQLIGKEGQP